MVVELDTSGSGAVDIDKGGTNAKTAQEAINKLTNVANATDEHVLTKDTSTGNAIFKAATGGGGAKTNATTSDPTVNDDSSGGYSVFSIWMNTSTPAIWMCFNASVGAAVWYEILIA